MTTVNVLDHGFVRLRNLAGPTRREAGFNHETKRWIDFDAIDIDVAQVARISFDQMDSERTYEQDMKLARYLLKHNHTSPFEMIQVWIEVAVPIFVDRQLVRHRTWRRNESSARYVVLPDKFYVPDQVGAKPKHKKQGQDSGLEENTQDWFRNSLREQCEKSYFLYETAIASGVANEHARLFLHLNHYVHWVGNVDLSNMFKFLRERGSDGAQVEARVYAAAILKLLKPHLPGLIQIFEEEVCNGRD